MDSFRTDAASVRIYKATTTAHRAPPIGLSEDERLTFARVIDSMKRLISDDPSDTLVDGIVAQLITIPGSDSAAALRPLVKCMPSNLVVLLPKILEAEGAAATTAMLSFVGKDVIYRMETAVAYGSAFLALTDLDCDVARQLRQF